MGERIINEDHYHDTIRCHERSPFFGLIELLDENGNPAFRDLRRLTNNDLSNEIEAIQKWFNKGESLKT